MTLSFKVIVSATSRASGAFNRRIDTSLASPTQARDTRTETHSSDPYTRQKLREGPPSLGVSKSFGPQVLALGNLGSGLSPGYSNSTNSQGTQNPRSLTTDGILLRHMKCSIYIRWKTRCGFRAHEQRFFPCERRAFPRYSEAREHCTD